MADLIATVASELDGACSARAVDYALACARSRIAAHDDERAVLVHGDVHEWNALPAGTASSSSTRTACWPRPSTTSAIIMREDPVELMTGDPSARARSLAARTGLDATAIWEWGVVERVSTGLLCTAIDLQPVGAAMLAAADHVVP